MVKIGSGRCRGVLKENLLHKYISVTDRYAIDVQFTG